MQVSARTPHQSSPTSQNKSIKSGPGPSEPLYTSAPPNTNETANARPQDTANIRIHLNLATQMVRHPRAIMPSCRCLFNPVVFRTRGFLVGVCTPSPNDGIMVGHLGCDEWFTIHGEKFSSIPQMRLPNSPCNHKLLWSEVLNGGDSVWSTF